MIEEVVNALMIALANDEKTKGKFVFGEIKPTYVFVGDGYDIIGNNDYHYEVKHFRHQTFSVEFHIEGANQVYERFIPYAKKLNINGLTAGRRGPREDGRYFILSGNYLPNNFNLAKIVTQLKENLLFMETQIGDDLRKIINPNLQMR